METALHIGFLRAELRDLPFDFRLCDDNKRLSLGKTRAGGVPGLIQHAFQRLGIDCFCGEMPHHTTFEHDLVKIQEYSSPSYICHWL